MTSAALRLVAAAGADVRASGRASLRCRAGRTACASSQPMGPPPMTASRRGSSVSEKTVSLVRKPASARPGISGWAARAPVAMIASRKRSVWPPTSTASRAGEPGRRRGRRPRRGRGSARPSRGRLRSARSRRSALHDRGEIDRDAVGHADAEGPPPRRASAAARAAASSALDGTQPKLRQSPPSRCALDQRDLGPQPGGAGRRDQPRRAAPITTRL